MGARTMNELKKKLDSYTIKVTPLSVEDGGGFKAVYEELGSTARGVGKSPSEAAAQLEDLALDTLSDMDLQDFPAPHKDAPWADLSGRVTLRLPKMLHAQLDRLAQQQGVSLNQLMTHSLQSAATAMLAGEEFGVCSRHTVNAVMESVTSIRQFMDSLSMNAIGGARNVAMPFTNLGSRKPSELHYRSMEASVA